MTSQMMDGALVARLQATDFLCCCCCDAGDRHGICHWEPSSSPLQAGVRWAGICWGGGGLRIPVVDAAKQCSTGEGLISGIQKHMAQILASPSGRNVDKIAEMDLRWEEDRLFNTGWHFQEGRDEVKATVSRR